MADPSDPPVSGSPYIIICSGRVDIATAKDLRDKVQAVCTCAGRLAAYMGIRYRQTFNDADLKPISDLQHELMNYQLGTSSLKKDEVEAKIAQLVVEFYTLEKKYTGHVY